MTAPLGRSVAAQGAKPKAVAEAAVEAAGFTNKLARRLTVDAMLLNLDRAEKLGCLDEASLDEMRHGKAPTIRKGRYTGDQLSVDHIIPRARFPQLDKVIANLELLPQRVNSAKQDKMGSPQRTLAKELQCAAPACKKDVEHGHRPTTLSRRSLEQIHLGNGNLP
jgi:hypothetical protein